jgi:iron complex outermembrane recepter protein
MFKRTGVCAALVAAFGVTQAQETLQRVEVTGSAIKRVNAEGALPVQTFTQEDIKRSGVTSVTDFIQQLPVMQGANVTVLADSVGGGGAGITSASIHDLGAQYTLVLLNGRRLAPATSGSTIDLNSIPLAAIDRVEVLTDGAGSLYGADAIAGVINFILKKGEAPFRLDVRATRPQRSGGNSENFSISKGLGDLERDGYSLFATLGVDRHAQLKASDRDFARSGIIPFTDGAGRQLTFFNGSSRSVPPNISVRYRSPTAENPDNIDTTSFNPYLLANGSCPPAHVQSGRRCIFDYTSTIEIAPELDRKSLFVSGELKLGASGLTLFSDLAHTNVATVARVAPYPGDFSIPLDHPLIATYVLPHLTQAQRDSMESVNVTYRLSELGNRVFDFDTKATHWVGGVRGTLGSFDLDSALTVSTQKQDQNYGGGFPLEEPFRRALLVDRTVDPFLFPIGQMPPAMAEALRRTQFIGNYNTVDIRLVGADARLSREVFKLDGGAAQLAFGADLRQTGYKQTANPEVANAEILFDSPQTEFDLQRWTAGAFAEMNLPVRRGLEFNVGARFDAVGAVTDKRDGDRRYGATQRSGTFKFSGRYQPSTELLVRGSVGTGFHTASMLQIAQPLTEFGVTAGAYDCPFRPGFDPLGYVAAGFVCDNGNQFEAFTGGNPDLKPEKSNQWTLGMVFEPNRAFSVGLDLWSVSVRDAVTNVSEDQIIRDPAKYLSLYTTKFKPSTGLTYVAIQFLPINIGRIENQGLDWDLKFRQPTPIGAFTGRLAGTWLLKSRYTTPGTDDQWESSLGRFGSNGAVSFRHIVSAQARLDTGAWAHALTANFRSGYTDVLQRADDSLVRDADGNPVDAQLGVPRYTTFDWQTQWLATKALTLTAGVQNLLGRKPPLSLRSTGAHQLGYDPRYASPVGRAFYLQGSLTF